MRSVIKSSLAIILASFLLFACDEADNFNEGPFFSKRTDILSFNLNDISELGGSPIQATINKKDSLITATVPFGTDTTALTPTITISPKATVSPASGITNTFADTAIYTVVAEDGTFQEWRVVIRQASQGAVSKLILSDPVWNFSQSGTGVPSFFTENGERGLAYGNNHLYFTKNNDKIQIIDAADGSTVGELNDTGITGGSPKIADVEISEDGSILACNSVEWTSDGGGPATEFKIYRWENEASTPTVFLTYSNTQYRMGDSFSVIGDVTKNAVILTTYGRKFLNPEGRGNLVFRWNVTDGVVDSAPTLVNIGGLPSLTKFGSRPHAQLLDVNSDSYYVNANDIEFTKTDLSGNFEARLPNSDRGLFNGFTSYFEIFNLDGKTILVTAFPRSSSESRMIIIDITNGIDRVTTDNVIITQDFVTGAEIANVNASGAVAVNKINNNKVEIYCLITNQALVKYELNAEL